MVTSSRDSSAYLGGVEGAPPLPPPGGYRAAQRVRTLGGPGPAPMQRPTAQEAPRERAGVLGWSTVVVAGLLGLVLLVMWAVRATDAIYGVVMLTLQLVVVLMVIAALVSARNRALGSIALTLVLLLNVGTMGAASALRETPATAAGADPETDRWVAYPGMKGQSRTDILDRTSLEQAERTSATIMKAMRERLSSEFGFDWVQGRGSSIRHERNGYGGQSMLVEFSSERWATTEPVTDYSLKLAAMSAIDEVLSDHGFYRLVSFNDPSSGFDPAYLERFYGSTDVRTQREWEWFSDDWPGPIRFYATLTDLTHDDDGTFRTAREAVVAGTSEPVEGLRLWFYVPEVLSEADVEEFERRMDEYGE